MESSQQISAVQRPREEEEEEEEAFSDGEFEFAFVPRDPDSEPAAADEIFSGGRIRPFYPIFGRGLPAEATNSAASAECDELDGLPQGSYCEWAPRSAPQSPERCRKSSSERASRRRWRLRDLVAGRSRSDGRERFVFMGPTPGRAGGEPNAKVKAEGKEEGRKKGDKVTEMDVVTAHKAFYGTGAGAKGGRQSFLPYRPELVGLFASANRLGRSRQPF